MQNGVVYIAQVLKRNRTLKVLNLSENKIDMQGLVAIAESLVSWLAWFGLIGWELTTAAPRHSDAQKFNSTLETLDMSLNPCCGPGLDGVSCRAVPL